MTNSQTLSNAHTLEHVISNGIAVHTLAAELCKKLKHRTEDPRVSMLLEDMVRHDSRMKTVLRQLADRVEPRVLETYLKHTLKQPPKTFIDSLTPESHNLSIEDIGALGQKIHTYLTDLFEHAARGCSSSSCSELLNHLVQLERAEHRTFSRAVLSTREF